ncbi:MAG: hypothetical protein LBT84_06680, partial [Spirochaetia bacterium]|nr:hypothetical protein [Spirochaetia bacterium]
MEIILLAEQDSFFGSGHMQRMCALLDYLNSNGFSARLFTHSSVPPQLPAELIIRELPKSAGLIVRDMRDS